MDMRFFFEVMGSIAAVASTFIAVFSYLQNRGATQRPLGNGGEPTGRPDQPQIHVGYDGRVRDAILLLNATDKQREQLFWKLFLIGAFPVVLFLAIIPMILFSAGVIPEPPAAPVVFSFPVLSAIAGFGWLADEAMLRRLSNNLNWMNLNREELEETKRFATRHRWKSGRSAIVRTLDHLLKQLP